MKIMLLHVVLGITLLNAQLKVVSHKELSVPSTQQWNQPLVSPSGKEIYLTNEGFNGIWQFSLETQLLKEITADPYSGFNFSLSDDGTKLVYRTTAQTGDHNSRKQQAVVLSITTGSKQVLHTGNTISIPRFSQNDVIIPEELLSRIENDEMYQRAPVVLGVDEGKILMMKQGVQHAVEPFPSGRYIWPSLSPDKSQIVAVDMEQGAFLCDLNGSNVILLGKCNAPRWSRSGKWIIGMDDRDDGHHITGSDIIAVSVDGTQRIRLTESPSLHEMYPAVSPTQNTIVTTTLDGKVFLLTFEEGE
jgi:Tol biopolymer transport system component